MRRSHAKWSSRLVIVIYYYYQSSQSFHATNVPFCRCVPLDKLQIHPRHLANVSRTTESLTPR